MDEWVKWLKCGEYKMQKLELKVASLRIEKAGNRISLHFE